MERSLILQGTGENLLNLLLERVKLLEVDLNKIYWVKVYFIDCIMCLNYYVNNNKKSLFCATSFLVCHLNVCDLFKVVNSQIFSFLLFIYLYSFDSNMLFQWSATMCNDIIYLL